MYVCLFIQTTSIGLNHARNVCCTHTPSSNPGFFLSSSYLRPAELETPLPLFWQSSWIETTSPRISGTLQGTNISHLGKRKIIFKSDFWWDRSVPWRVPKMEESWTLQPAILGVAFPLHKPYPYSLHRWVAPYYVPEIGECMIRNNKPLR